MRRGFALAFVCLVGGIAWAGDKLVIAHRGASGYLPEHTLEAYALAHGLGAHYIEADLVMTKDGVLICLHDLWLEATTDAEEAFPGRKRADGHWYAVDFTLAEIKALRVHERTRGGGVPQYPGRFPVSWAKFEVPTLAEMIELVQGLNKATGREVGIYPELKRPAWHAEQGLPMEQPLLALLDRYGYTGAGAKAYIQSFEPDSLKKLRFELGTKLPLVLLLSWEQPVTQDGLAQWATYVNGIGPDKRIVAANPAVVRWAQDRGLSVHAWTFRQDALPMGYATLEEELEQFLFVYGVDGVFSDFPDLAAAWLGRRPK